MSLFSLGLRGVILKLLWMLFSKQPRTEDGEATESLEELDNVASELMVDVLPAGSTELFDD